jgi:hypothetical protein
VDQRQLTVIVPHEDRAVVSEPRVVDRQLQRFHALAAAPTDVARFPSVADHHDGLERPDRAGCRRPVVPGGLEMTVP